MRIVVIVGNPKPASRTAVAGALLASLIDPVAVVDVVDVIDLGPGLLGWGDPGVAVAVESVQSADLLIVASPTFKGTYSGVLKLFLDQFATSAGLGGIAAVPLMLGAGPMHALAPELTLKPVLVELGAVAPAQGLYILDSRHDDPEAYATWLAQWGDVVRAASSSA